MAALPLLRKSADGDDDAAVGRSLPAQAGRPAVSEARECRRELCGWRGRGRGRWCFEPRAERRAPRRVAGAAASARDAAAAWRQGRRDGHQPGDDVRLIAHVLPADARGAAAGRRRRGADGVGVAQPGLAAAPRALRANHAPWLRRACVQAQLAAVAAGTMVPHGAFEAEESLLRPRPRLRLRLLRISRPQPRGADEPAAPGRGEGRSTSGKTTLVGRWRGRRRPPAKPGASDPAAEYTACATNAAGFNSLVKAASEML